MSPADYPYPPDEFDGAAASAGPRGVHRTPRSWWSRFGPFVAVLVLVPVLAYGVVTVLSDGLTLPWQGAAQDDQGAVVPQDDDPVSPEPEEPTPTEEPVATPTEEPEPPAVVDLARAVQVFNATSTSGLAGSARDRLEEAGFTEVSIGNWDGDDVATSTVYYPTPDDVATAQAVADALAIGTVTESAEQATDGIVAVLAGDFTP